MTSNVPEDPKKYKVRSWIKFLQIFCNLILSLFGKGGLAVSILCKVGLPSELKLLNHYQTLHVNVFFACSIVLIAIAWLGVFTGSKSCHKWPLTNGLLLGAFLIGSASYIITMGVVTDYKHTGRLYKQMQREMKDYQASKHPHIIDVLQTTLSCCGLNDFNTWNVSDLPDSCCRKQINQKGCDLDSPNLQTNGCFKQFVLTARYYSWVIFALFISVGILQVFGMILSCLQSRIIKDKQKKKLVEESPFTIPRTQIGSQTTSKVKCEAQSNEEKKEKEEKIQEEGEKEKEQEKEEKIQEEREEKKGKEKEEKVQEEGEEKKGKEKKVKIQEEGKEKKAKEEEKQKEVENNKQEETIAKKDTKEDVIKAGSIEKKENSVKIVE